ncbi:hypothetical protein NDK25_22090 [Niallia taxi]|nr:hypothetical protein [Niallia taxi]MDE5054909.1 hypothetical protein [Niallia taxi]
MFNENSALVKIWVRNIREGNYTVEQVPKLSNLQEAVKQVLDSQNLSTS